MRSAFLLLLACAPATTEKPKPVDTKNLPALLVMPLKADDTTKTAASALDEMILQAVHDSRKYRAMGSADINALLGVERMKDAVGCSESNCIAEIGGALGAQFVLAPQISVLGAEVVLSARMLDAKRNEVLERGSARGGGDAQTLAKLVAQVMGDILHVQVTVQKSAGGASIALGKNYDAYTDAVTAIGKKMGQQDYTGVLALVEKYEKAPPPDVPRGQDFNELLTFYKVTGCFMLKKSECMQAAAKKYNDKWPGGMYKTSVQSYVDQLLDEEIKRDAGKDDLKKRLAEIEASQVDATQKEEMVAWAYFSANLFDEAGTRFDRLQASTQEPDKHLDHVNNAAMAYNRAGNFKRARELLEKAQSDYPKPFRLKGMHHTLSTIPK